MRLTTTWLSATGVKIPDLWPLNIVLNLSASGTQLAKAEELLSLLASAFSAVPQAESTLPAATNESFQLLFVQMPALGAMFYKTKKKTKQKNALQMRITHPRSSREENWHSQGVTLSAAFTAAVPHGPAGKQQRGTSPWVEMPRNHLSKLQSNLISLEANKPCKKIFDS